MALKMDLPAAANPNADAIITDAYHRINSFMCRFDGSIDVDVAVYASESARRAGKSTISQRTLTVGNFDHAEAKSVKKKLYEYLKTLPEYEDAVDLL
jgi:hypothetical protein